MHSWRQTWSRVWTTKIAYMFTLWNTIIEFGPNEKTLIHSVVLFSFCFTCCLYLLVHCAFLSCAWSLGAHDEIIRKCEVAQVYSGTDRRRHGEQRGRVVWLQTNGAHPILILAICNLELTMTENLTKRLSVVFASTIIVKSARVEW